MAAVLMLSQIILPHVDLRLANMPKFLVFNVERKKNGQLIFIRGK